jgi:hypothetical protein
LSFPELIFLENILNDLRGRARITQEALIPCGQQKFPVYSVAFGSKNPGDPVLALVGGVHGQEKIGAQVVLSYLETLSELVQWDDLTNLALERLKIVFYPIVNPAGMFLLRRGNGNRVDLMRNAPGGESRLLSLLAGQRISPYLPWYRGKSGAPMEPEAQALCNFVRREIFPARVSIALDCHSGFGTTDRLWFPYSRSFEPFPDLAEAFALKNLLDSTYPNHVYCMEPVAGSYLIQGDLWDYLYDEQQAQSGAFQRFLPLTLEMGSWLWLKKNPVQLFSALGLFQPMGVHRHKRVLRRHLPLLDFLQKALVSPKPWAHLAEAKKQKLRAQAIAHWDFRSER